MKTQIFYTILFFTVIGWVSAQQFYYEDFENFIPSEWSVDVGNYEISNSIVHSGNFAMKIWANGNSTAWINNVDFLGSYGNYEAWFYVTGSVSDAYFSFQVISPNTRYQVGFNPNGTDNPKLTLVKLVNGNTTYLANNVPANFSLNQWFKINIIRKCNGDILVYTNDILKITCNDNEITQDGNFKLGAWTSSVYVDDISITSFTNENLVPDDTTLCAKVPEELGVEPIYLNYYWSNGETTSSINLFFAEGISQLYTISVTDSNLCVISDSVLVTFVVCSFSKFVQVNTYSVNVFPNPTSNIINLSLNNCPKPYNVSIFDNLGKLIYYKEHIFEDEISINPYINTKGTFSIIFSNFQEIFYRDFITFLPKN